ncbi:MAG TPA: lysophospholipid acyltransferase family protein [Xanthobacteraceae bacterium]|nr:lysophospholipid acyltransferase family protein [Xanthobacteraceae bacterium]
MIRLVCVFAAFGALTAALLPFQALAVSLALPLRRRIPVFYHRLLCAMLGVRVREIGRRIDAHPLLIVANHSSWLDITVISAVAPVVFVAKQEIARWPLIGLLAKLQRTVFVDRTRRHKTREVNAEIASRLTGGDPVVLFGEGTASDGNRVLAFRSALIGAARDALAEAEHTGRVWIQPLSIAYTRLHGLPLCRHERPRVAWYGRMAMGPHLARVARHGQIDVTVIWGEPVAFDQQSDRKQIARALETEVRRRTIGALRGLADDSAPHSFLPQNRL